MKSHSQFMEEVKVAVSLPAQTKKALSEEAQTKSDLKAIERRDRLCVEDEQ